MRISNTLLACATVWRNVIVFLHNLCIYLLVCIYAGGSVTLATLLVIPGVVLMCLRDLLELVGDLLQISLFLTPIFRSVNQLKGRVATLAQLNPIHHFIVLVREPLLGHAPSPLHWIAAIAITIAGWTLTVAPLRRYRYRSVYWL